IRTIAIQVEPSIRSLSALIRRVRFVQAHAQNALPLGGTCSAPGARGLAGQGIPGYRLPLGHVRRAGQTRGAPAGRPAVRPPALGTPEAGGKALPSLPSPRASLPPAPTT